MTLFVFYHGTFTLVREHGLFTRMDFVHITLFFKVTERAVLVLYEYVSIITKEAVPRIQVG